MRGIIPTEASGYRMPRTIRFVLTRQSPPTSAAATPTAEMCSTSSAGNVFGVTAYFCTSCPATPTARPQPSIQSCVRLFAMSSRASTYPTARNAIQMRSG
nr:hypothetical protein [Subtercola boreus]